MNEYSPQALKKPIFSINSIQAMGSNIISLRLKCFIPAAVRKKDIMRGKDPHAA
jgi:hypothetical protein